VVKSEGIQRALWGEGLRVGVDGVTLRSDRLFYAVMKKRIYALLLTALLTGCGGRQMAIPSHGLEVGVLIKSVSAAILLPLVKVPSAQGQSLKLKDLAETLEGPVFGQLQRDDPSMRVRVAVEDEIRERTVSFDLGSDVTALELLTVIAVEGRCQVIVDDSMILLKDASAK
jgi:hypothetical protein